MSGMPAGQRTASSVRRTRKRRRTSSVGRWGSGITTRGASLPLLLSLLVACAGAGPEGESLRRGDEAFARGDLAEALAEYRLSLVQGADDVDTFLRVAHAYARSGRVDEALEHYQRAVDNDPDVADLGASDLLRVAREAIGRQDGIAAAAAVEAAVQLKPGVSLAGISLPLARHFALNGRYGQALPFFQKAIRETDSAPEVVFEMALAHEELGDCRRALVFFEQIRAQVTVAMQSEVDWNIGNCSANLAMEAKAEEDFDEALRLHQVTIELGEPRNRLARAWFEIGEILESRGECSAAVQAYDQVARQDLPGGFIVEQAERRVDEIRFRRGGEGPC